MNKNTTTTIFAVIVIILLALVVWKYSNKKEVVPETPAQTLDKATANDSTTSIDSSLNSINVDSNTDTDLENIDKDINGL